MSDARCFVRALTFFVMVFQDVLRVNERRVSDPVLREVLRLHRLEDHDHDQWFLRDLDRLEIRCEVADLFGSAFERVRDAAYSVMSEVFRTEADGVRVALVLALEATGEVFFSRVPRYMNSLHRASELEYFSHGHAHVEENHSLLDAKMASLVDREPLPQAVLDESLAMVDRLFSAMTTMVEAFEAAIVADRKPPAGSEAA